MTRLRSKYKKLKKAYERLREELRPTMRFPHEELKPVKMSFLYKIPNFPCYATPQDVFDYMDQRAALEFADKLVESNLMIRELDCGFVRYQLRVLKPCETELFISSGLLSEWRERYEHTNQ